MLKRLHDKAHKSVGKALQKTTLATSFSNVIGGRIIEQHYEKGGSWTPIASIVQTILSRNTLRRSLRLSTRCWDKRKEISKQCRQPIRLITGCHSKTMRPVASWWIVPDKIKLLNGCKFPAPVTGLRSGGALIHMYFLT